MSNNASKGLFFIFLTVLIDVIGLGIIIPVMPKLIEELIGGTLSDASRYGGLLMLSYAATQFLFAPVLGNLSDRYGRRPILLFSLVGFSINYLLMGLAPSMMWLFVGRFIAGITGASYTVASAYIADISTAEKKAQNFGLLGAAFGLGFIVGPLLGGVLGHYGARIPFYAAAILSFLNFLYGYFIIPESLKKEDQRAFEWRNANPIGAFKQLAKYPHLKALLICIFLINVASHAVQSTWSYYTMERYQWDERMVGVSLGFVGVLVAIVQAGLIRIIIPKLGVEKSILLGSALFIIALPMMGFAYTPLLLFIAIVPYVFAGIVGPAIQSLISNETPQNEQGQIQGGLTSIISLTAIVGPPVMSWLFAHFTDKKEALYIPGAPFFLGFLLTFISFIIAVYYFRNKKTA